MGLFGFGGFNAFIALYALDVGLDRAAPLFAIFALVVVTVRSVGAKIPDRLGPLRTVRIALVALAAGLATMGFWDAPVGLYVGTLVFSVGQALAFPALMSLAFARSGARARGGGRHRDRLRRPGDRQRRDRARRLWPTRAGTPRFSW